MVTPTSLNNTIFYIFFSDVKVISPVDVRFVLIDKYRCCVGANCRQSAWRRLDGSTAMGGQLHVGPRTIQQCLDHCNDTSSCVAVDIDVNVVPLRCWTHVDAADLRSDNIYGQQGTYHYQLITRCFNPRAG